MQPLIQRVFHPTDFSDASGTAFAHALAVAIARKTRLTIMNASKGFRGEDWSGFPGVSDTLKRWGLLDASSSRSDVFSKLSIKVKKIGVDASDPANAILDFLAQNPTDLVVMATHAREGLPRLLQRSVAEKVARVAGVRSLLVPSVLRILGDKAWYFPSWLEWMPNISIEGRRPSTERSATPRSMRSWA